MAGNLGFSVKIDGVETTISTLGEVKSAIKQLTEEAKKTDLGSARYAEIVNDIRNAKTELKTFMLESKAHTSDIKGAHIEMASGIRTSMEGATNALSVFGAESSIVSAASEKSSQVLIALNSIREIGEIKLGEATLKRVAMEKLASISAGALTLAITAVVAVTAALVAWWNRGSDEAERLKEKQKSLTKVAEEGNKAYAEAAVAVKSWTQRIQDAKKGIGDKKIVLEEYNKTMGDAVGKADSLDKAEKNLIDNGPAYVQSMKDKAEATATMNLYTAALTDNMNLQMKMQALQDDKQFKNAPRFIQEAFLDELKKQQKDIDYRLDYAGKRFNELNTKIQANPVTATVATINKEYDDNNKDKNDKTGEKKEQKHQDEMNRIIEKALDERRKLEHDANVTAADDDEKAKKAERKRVFDLEQADRKKVLDSIKGNGELEKKARKAVMDEMFAAQQAFDANELAEQKKKDAKLADEQKKVDDKRQAEYDKRMKETSDFVAKNFKLSQKQLLDSWQDEDKINKTNWKKRRENLKNELALELAMVGDDKEKQYEINRKYAAANKQLDEDQLAAKRAMIQQGMDLVEGLGGFLQNIAGKNKKLAKVGILVEKGASIAKAVMNTSEAVTKDLGKPWKIAFDIATGALSVATIIAAAVKGVQDVDSVEGGSDERGGPKGSTYARGGVLRGPSHAQGGIATPFGEMEGGEAIINKRSTAMHAGLLSLINQSGGGVPIKSTSAVASSKDASPVFKTYVVASEMTSQQQAQDKVKKLARL